MVHRRSVWEIVTLVFLLASLPAVAGPYTDDLSRCLVSSTTEKDKTELVRWLFAVSALHPDVASVAPVSDEQRTQSSRNAGHLFEKLLTESCRAQLRDAVRYEGNQALEVSFGVLGQVAMRKLMEHPAVTEGFGEMQRYVDTEKLNAALQTDGP